MFIQTGCLMPVTRLALWESRAAPPRWWRRRASPRSRNKDEPCAATGTPCPPSYPAELGPILAKHRPDNSRLILAVRSTIRECKPHL